MSIYNILKRMIELGRTEGLAEKINVFYAADQLTEAQYVELMKMLDGGKTE
jgi:hypothetical protein